MSASSSRWDDLLHQRKATNDLLRERREAGVPGSRRGKSSTERGDSAPEEGALADTRLLLSAAREEAANG